MLKNNYQSNINNKGTVENTNLFAFLFFLLVIPVTHIFDYYTLFGMFSTRTVVVFSYFKLLILGFFIIKFLYNFKNFKNKIVLSFILFYIYLFLYTILDYLNYEIISVQVTEQYFRYMYVILISYFTYFIIGFYNNSYKKYLKYLLIAYILLTMNSWFNLDTTTLYISFEGIQANLSIGLYQELGDTYAILGLIVIVLIKNKYLKFLLIIISFATLFILMSRSSLYVYTVVVLFYLLILYRFKAVVYIAIISLFIALLTIDSGEYYDIIMNSRLTSFMRTGEDGSWAERKEIAEVGIDAIKNYWLIGDYAGDVLQFGERGHYIHNYLSILRQFGIIPFIVLIYIIVIYIINLINWMLNHKKYSDYYNIFIILFLFNLVEIVIARSFGCPYIFMSIGMLASVYSHPALIYKKETDLVEFKN